MGIMFMVFDSFDYDGLEKAFKENKCSLYFFELLMNLYFCCVDIEWIVNLCKFMGCFVCIDGIFVMLCNFRAFDFGVDLVIYSASKFMGGYNDVFVGVIVGKKEVVVVCR